MNDDDNPKYSILREILKVVNMVNDMDPVAVLIDDDKMMMVMIPGSVQMGSRFSMLIKIHRHHHYYCAYQHHHHCQHNCHHDISAVSL